MKFFRVGRTGLLGAAAILAFNATGVSGGHADATTSAPAHGTDFVPLAVHPGEPCPGAVATPLADLPTHAGASAWMPATALANRTDLTGAWSCAGAPALTFGDVTILFEQAGDVADPKALFTDLAAQPSGGQVETLLGQPAFVKGPDATGGLGEAVVFLGTTRVTVIGNAQATTDDLAAIVSSIDVSDPLN